MSYEHADTRLVQKRCPLGCHFWKQPFWREVSLRTINTIFYFSFLHFHMGIWQGPYVAYRIENTRRMWGQTHFWTTYWAIMPHRQIGCGICGGATLCNYGIVHKTYFHHSSFNSMNLSTSFASLVVQSSLVSRIGKVHLTILCEGWAGPGHSDIHHIHHWWFFCTRRFK